MPNPTFVPLIGSSFDALAGQQQQWAGFNQNVDQGNLNRLAAAQEVQNRWLENVARAQALARQQDLGMQEHAADIAHADVTSARQEAEQRRQFDIGTVIDRERLKAEDARTAQMGKVQEENLALQQHAASQKIENTGQTAASTYLVSKNTADAATAEYNNLEDELNAAKAEQQAEIEKPANKRNNQKLVILDSRQKALSRSLRQAGLDKQRSENAFQAYVTRLTAEGFRVDESDGNIVHIDTGKKWSFKNVLAKARTQDGMVETSPQSNWFKPMLPDSNINTATAQWPGLNALTATVNAAAPVAVPPAVVPPVIAPPPQVAPGGRVIVRGPDGKLVYSGQ